MALPALAFGAAKDDGQGYLTQLLEKNLSSAGRVVHITGFEGALSSKASLKTLTIADSKGVWITLKGVTLDWSRLALLQGKVEVNQLTADEIDMPRPAITEPRKAPPQAAAPGFSLPQLPVSVSIGKIEAKKVVLGATVLGQPAVVKVSGSAQLAGGSGKAKIDLQRIDGKTGQILLDTSYANSSGQLAVTLKVEEAAGGIVTTALGLPDAPALALNVDGKGPIDDFDAKISLATDNQPRLSGNVVLKGEKGPDGKLTNHFTADLGGDIAPLFAPQYQRFFGPNVKLQVAGARLPSGQVRVSKLDLKARQIALQGQVDIGADGMPSRIDLTGRLAAQDGGPVLLPLPGGATRVDHADLSLRYNAATGDGWKGTARIAGLSRPGMALADATLTGQGRIAKLNPQDKARGIDGTLTLQGSGMSPADPALAAALGGTVNLTTQFHYVPGEPLQLPQFSLSGADYGLSGKAEISGLDKAMQISGQASATSSDIARFSALARRKLSGSAKAQISGTFALLAGTFNLGGSVDGTDLTIGVPQIDALMKGNSHVGFSVSRDTSGLTLQSLQINARSLNVSAEGTVNTHAADIRANLSFGDIAQLGPGYGGSLDARLALTQQGTTRSIALRGAGKNLRLGQKIADRLLRGQTDFNIAAHQTGAAIGVDKIDLHNPQLSLSALPRTNGSDVLAVRARLADLAQLASGFPGPVSAEGTVTPAAKDFAVDLAMRGPGGIDALLKGRLARDLSSADLKASGSARAELINPLIAPRSVSGPVRFDLALHGPPKLGSLSGRLDFANGRIAAPVLGISATNAGLNASFTGGQARIAGQMDVGGGTVKLSGPVSLLPPYDSDIAVALNRVGLKDPELFATRASGALTLKGPLTGGAAIAGRVALSKTEIRVPSTGLGGSDTIPQGLVQKGASAPVLATLKRAGLGAKPGATTAAAAAAAPLRRPFRMNLTISAPEQLFVRGRGLDAELGGQIALTGTSSDIIPIGSFDLKRGRLDILGKRLDLTEGSLRLQGRFVPYVHLVASSTSNGVTSIVTVDGVATDPKITFSSSPALPQEEVLSQLLFGQGLSKISPFQAAQLAAAVATLAGKGGEGIVSKLRRSFGLDNLDIQTDAQGQTSVKLGKYISRRLYTDVTVGQNGTSQVDLNLNVTKSVTLKGSAASTGNTGIGVYYQRDY
ncbi:hypothetical protein U879_11075 [Defluviimonas sp. 20V17]|nr:hypothetical protein U879_11075 [Defluviimonas sp. 20V17]